MRVVPMTKISATRGGKLQEKQQPNVVKCQSNIV